jgi:hypothetical protein
LKPAYCVDNDLGLGGFRLVHGNRHPLARHVEELVSNPLVLNQSGKTHAVARVTDVFPISGHVALPLSGGSATGLSGIGACVLVAVGR